MRQLLLVACAAFAFAGTAHAQTLIHDYEFNGSGVTDSVGGVNGTLFGDATVSGGYLHLDGDGDYAQLDGAIFPSAGTDFSVYFAYTGHNAQPGTYTEVVSQDGGSFYIGTDPGGNIRVSDAFGVGTAFPTGGDHAFLMTNSTINGTRLYIDGSLVFSSGGTVASSPYGGSIARFGRQYGGWGEYFQGGIDAVRVFDGVASWEQASANVGAVPEPASWTLMLGGFGLAGLSLRGTRRKRAFA
jgi:hypothetical protein